MKCKFFALAALMLGLASCQQDFDAQVQVGNEVDFRLTVDAPEITRAGDEGENEKAGMNSAYGAIDYLQGAVTGDTRIDWSDVDLRYSLEVYDASDNYTDATPVKDRQVIIVDEYNPVTFELRLIPNRNYHFVVFADFVPQGATVEDVNKEKTMIDHQRELGLCHKIGENLRDITIKNDAINDERADAYFATKDITISNSASQDIELKRPYGKLRVVTTDLDQLNINIEPAKISVKYYAKHPVAFNAVTGEIDTNVEEVALTFESEYRDGVCKEDLTNHFYTEGYDDYELFGSVNANGVERHTHMTLFTDYILAEEEQNSIHFDIEVFDRNDAIIKKTEFCTDIPVQRNHLTTIIGNVLTTATEIDVTINDNFEDETVIGGVTSAKELQEAIDRAKAGEVNVIDIWDNIAGNVKIVEIPETTIIINGQGYKYDGTMEIIGKSEYKNATTIFKNINFETNDDSSFVGASFIYCNDQDGYNRYPDNVTIVDCTFKGEDDTTVGASFRAQNGNLIIDGCEMTAGHSFIQLKSCGKANVSINNTTITAGRGIALGNAGNVAINDITINAEMYGVRADGCTATTNIEASDINANIPVIVRKLTAGEYTLNFSDTALTAGTEGANAEGYQVVFTNGDDEATFVEPAGKFNTNGTYIYKIFPGPAVGENTIVIYDIEDLMQWAWLVNHSDINYSAMFVADIELPAYEIAYDGKKYYYDYEKPITVTDGIPSGSNWITVGSLSNKYTEAIVEGNNHTIKGLMMNNNSVLISGFLGYCENIIVKDLTFDAATLYSTQQYCSPIAYVDDGSYIYNVHTTNSTIVGTDYVSGIVSMLMDHFDTKGLCDRIENDPTIQRFMPYTTMEKCTTSNTTVVGSGEFAGGICGKAYGVIIYDCHNEADVTGNKNVGGVAGYLRDYQKNEHGCIVNCSSTNSTIVGNTYYGAICGALYHDKNHTGAITAVVGCYTDSTVANNKIVDKFNSGEEKAWGNYAEGTTVDIDALNAEIAVYNDFIEEYNNNTEFYSTYFEQCVYSDYKFPTSKMWTEADFQ